MLKKKKQQQLKRGLRTDTDNFFLGFDFAHLTSFDNMSDDVDDDVDNLKITVIIDF